MTTKRIVFLGMVFFTILISGCTQTPPGVNYEDCGSSDVCFSDYAKTCTPAKATISSGGLTYTETIKGYEGDNCILNLIYSESNISAFDVVGKEMDCRVPKASLGDYKDYLEGEQMMKSCTGSLIDYLNSMV